MVAPLLHLVDQNGRPAPKVVQVAVENAYRWALIDYKHFDRAILAEMAEAVASAMCRHLHAIQFPRRYAMAALQGKLQEWYRAHPGFEIVMEREELERVAGGNWRSFTAANLGIWLAEARMQLNERDQQILGLMEQDLGSPRQIARAFDISHSAATKALQRVKARMAALLMSEPTAETSDEETAPRRRQFNF